MRVVRKSHHAFRPILCFYIAVVGKKAYYVCGWIVLFFSLILSDDPPPPTEKDPQKKAEEREKEAVHLFFPVVENAVEWLLIVNHSSPFFFF